MTESGLKPLPMQRHLAAIVESSDDAILSKDRKAIIRSWNPAAERLYGYTAEEAIGQPVSILVPERLKGEELRILNTILEGGKVDHYETERVRRDGTSVWISLTVSPVRDDDGTVVAASVIARDITERREHERERARLFAESEAARAAAERSRGRLAFLARASGALSETLDLARSLNRLAELVVEELATSCVIDLLEGGRLKTVAIAHRQPPPDGAADLRPVGSLLEEALETGHTRVHSNVPLSLVWEGAEDDGAAMSAMTVPIAAGGAPLGTLALLCSSSERHYDEDDAALITELAHRTALAVQNAQAFRAEHELALTLQRSLLPRRLRNVPGLAFAVRYLPGGSTLNVGGDWYDLIPTADGSLMGAIGDVAGRGAVAASIMGQLRNAVRAYVFDGRGPADTADRVNQLMRSFERPEMATLALIAVSPSEDVVTLVRAGHPPPFVRRVDGSVERLEGRACLPLGALSHTAYTETRHSVESGSTVVLYTDGLVERRGETIDDGLDRLQGVLEQAPDDLEQLADYLTSTLLEDESKRSDDVALLLLRRLPLDPARFHFRQPAEPDALAQLRRSLREWLEARPAPRQDRHDMLTACSEAAANVVEHAYPGNRRALEVEGRRSVDGIVDLVVRDRGRWRPERRTGGGRGLKLIGLLVDEVAIETGEAGTEVRMRRRLPPGEDVAS